MNKTVNQKAWFFVLPVVLLVAFSAIIPLMTVVNYSVQESFGENEFFAHPFEQVAKAIHHNLMGNDQHPLATVFAGQRVNQGTQPQNDITPTFAARRTIIEFA